MEKNTNKQKQILYINRVRSAKTLKHLTHNTSFTTTTKLKLSTQYVFT